MKNSTVRTIQGIEEDKRSVFENRIIKGRFDVFYLKTGGRVHTSEISMN